MKRRELIALGITAPVWTKPVVEFIVLPAHGRMSYDDPPKDEDDDCSKEDISPTVGGCTK